MRTSKQLKDVQKTEEISNEFTGSSSLSRLFFVQYGVLMRRRAKAEMASFELLPCFQRE